MGKDGNKHLIAILPERKRNPGRIKDESNLNWPAEVIRNDCYGESIYFLIANYRATESRN
jgi:hypothetical protein